jgi:hypothetical protein
MYIYFYGHVYEYIMYEKSVPLQYCAIKISRMKVIFYVCAVQYTSVAVKYLKFG